MKSLRFNPNVLKMIYMTKRRGSPYKNLFTQRTIYLVQCQCQVRIIQTNFTLISYKFVLLCQFSFSTCSSLCYFSLSQFHFDWNQFPNNCHAHICNINFNNTNNNISINCSISIKDCMGFLTFVTTNITVCNNLFNIDNLKQAFSST